MKLVNFLYGLLLADNFPTGEVRHS
jgi:hypothetical protein